MPKLDTSVQPERLYSPCGVSAAYVSTLVTTFSAAERCAGSRAILRYQQHKKDHHETRTAGGLHPMYIDLNGLGHARMQEREDIDMLLKETLDDLFDAVATLDRIDGGITLLLRCPGYEATGPLVAENITVDMYVSPRELKEGGKEMSKHMALLSQAFGADIALPHLRRFQTRCGLEGVKPPSAPTPGKQLRVEGPSYLPPATKDGPHRARCRPAGTLIKDISIHNMPRLPLAPATSVARLAISKSELDNDDNGAKLAPERWSKDVVAAVRHSDSLESLVSAKDPSNGAEAVHWFQCAIISLGPQTDAMIDRFKLGDDLIPRLRALTCNVRSTRWEAVLRSSHWGLSYEQATNLSKAMLADISGDQTQKVQISMSFGTKIILTLLVVSLFAIIPGYYF